MIGQGSGTGNPPFSFPSPTTTRSGSATRSTSPPLVANTLGLKPDFRRSSWEGLFLGIDSGASDVGFSNITVTEARKDLYDFASYRTDILSLIARKSDPIRFSGYQDLAGQTIAVGSGTNQEKILVDWSEKLKAEGRAPITIKYYQDVTGVWSALNAGQIDAYFGPNPINAFHDAQVRGTPNETTIVGQVSGAGSGLTGLIAATTKKNNPLIEPVQEALDAVIKGGQYQQVLRRWNLDKEAVKSSLLNRRGSHGRDRLAGGLPPDTGVHRRRPGRPRARPLLDDLAVEYSSRYGRPFSEVHLDLLAYPASQFAPPDGGLVLALIGDEPVAGGAFQRYDDHTDELKRIWTSEHHRRRGFGLLVVAELERRSAAAGYSEVFLTTGWRQPEAVALYVSAGYTRASTSRRTPSRFEAPPVPEDSHPYVIGTGHDHSAIAVLTNVMRCSAAHLTRRDRRTASRVITMIETRSGGDTTVPIRV